MTGTGNRPRLAVVGAGDRGTTYASLAADAGAVIAAVAEPDDNRRTGFGERFDVPADCRSESWDCLELTSDEVDGTVITTMDYLHVDPALRFAELGVPMLLEKPIGPSWAEWHPAARRAAGEFCADLRGSRPALRALHPRAPKPDR